MRMRPPGRETLGVQTRARAEGDEVQLYPPRKQTAKSLAVIEPVVEIGPQPEEEYLALEINGAAYDRIFSMLTLYQKNIAIGAALCADEDE
jgi:hypothetical protein